MRPREREAPHLLLQRRVFERVVVPRQLQKEIALRERAQPQPNRRRFLDQQERIVGARAGGARRRLARAIVPNESSAESSEVGPAPGTLRAIPYARIGPLRNAASLSARGCRTDRLGPAPPCAPNSAGSGSASLATSTRANRTGGARRSRYQGPPALEVRHEGAPAVTAAVGQRGIFRRDDRRVVHRHDADAPILRARSARRGRRGSPWRRSRRSRRRSVRRGRAPANASVAAVGPRRTISRAPRARDLVVERSHRGAIIGRPAWRGAQARAARRIEDEDRDDLAVARRLGKPR